MGRRCRALLFAAAVAVVVLLVVAIQTLNAPLVLNASRGEDVVLVCPSAVRALYRAVLRDIPWPAEVPMKGLGIG